MHCFHLNAFLRNFHLKTLCNISKNFYEPLKNVRGFLLQKHEDDKFRKVSYFDFINENLYSMKLNFFIAKKLVK